MSLLLRCGKTNRLQSAIDQILNASGKHIRPYWYFWPFKACGQVTDNTINSAVLLELLHTATLIHDDVIDRDKTASRRSFPECHIRQPYFGFGGRLCPFHRVDPFYPDR